MSEVYKEVWTGELVESFKPEIKGSFLETITDYSRYVKSSSDGENQIIHLVDVGADPKVLVNNLTYPVGYQELKDGDLAFQLDKYQTKATRISDDELYAISYDKISLVNKKHKEAILVAKFGKAIHALAPSSDSVDTPIISTSGAEMGGKKLACIDDVIDLASRFNEAGIPDDGKRVLVLHSTHVTGILKEEKHFYKDYANVQKSSELKSLFYGFKVYVYHNNPFYNTQKMEKIPYGKSFNAKEHNFASVAFYAPDMFRAQGSTKMYYDRPDTQHQSTAINYRHYYLVSPRKNRAIGALVTVNS